MSWPGLPILVMLADRPVMLLGEGEAADAKRRLLVRAGASVVVEQAEARLAIVAIEDEAVAIAAVARLKARGVLVNAVDRPALCDFTLPAVVDRAPVLVAVMTGGVSAGLAAAVRQRLEGVLPASLGRLAVALGAAKGRLRARWPEAGERRRAIGAALAGPLDPLETGAVDRVEAALFPDVGAGAPVPTPGSSLAGRGAMMALSSSDPDDLTLRQARVLALADRVLHARDVPGAILDRARADAVRIGCDARPELMAAGDVWVEMA